MGLGRGVGLASAVATSARPAEAAMITLDGVDYDVTTVTGSFDELETQLKSNPWWGDWEMASRAAEKVKFYLGSASVLNLELGPFFAYRLNAGDLGGTELCGRRWLREGRGPGWTGATPGPLSLVRSYVVVLASERATPAEMSWG